MATIKIYKRGYDYINGQDFIQVPWAIDKWTLDAYIRAIFGVDAYKNYKFVLIHKTR